MDAQVVRGRLRALMDGSASAADVFPEFARNVPQFFIPSARADSTFELRHGSQRFGVVFSDPEAAAAMPGGGGAVQPISAMDAITGVIRNGLDGLVINPDTERTMLDARMLRLLYREYALEIMRKSTGAWVRVKADHIWMVELERGLSTVPVYLTEADADQIGREQGGAPEFRPWADIRRQCRLTGAEVYLQFGHPEQCGVPRRLLTDLGSDADSDPLDQLEQVLAASLGIANATAVWDALAQLDFIWTLEDEEGGIVALADAMDLFTSAAKAEAFIAELKQKVPRVGAVYPRYLPAQGLFRALAQQQPAICINRGSSDAWMGLRDTIPNVRARLEATAATESIHKPVQSEGPLGALGRWARGMFRGRG